MWPSKIKLLNVFNVFWRSEERKDCRNLIKFEFFLEKFGFVNHLKSWTYISYHKNSFSNGLQKKYFQNFQNFYFFRIQPIKPIFKLIEMGRENLSFSLKSWVSSIHSRFLLISQAFSYAYFDFCLIPLNRSDFDFLKHIGIILDFFNYSLSFSPIPLLIRSHSILFYFILFYFWSFSLSKIQRLSS